jgi:hypothetical protein
VLEHDISRPGLGARDLHLCSEVPVAAAQTLDLRRDRAHPIEVSRANQVAHPVYLDLAEAAVDERDARRRLDLAADRELVDGPVLGPA